MNFKPLQVFVIDGDPAVRDSLATLMGLHGHQVRAFARGGDFLAALGEGAVDRVVCDADLPDIDGVELFRTLQRTHPTVRFALLISRNDPAGTARARRSGIDTVLHKPLVHGHLTRFVASR